MANSNTFSITSQSQFNETLLWISDLYKDVYGSRPRGYNFSNFTFKELTEFVNDLSNQQDKDLAIEKASEMKSLKDVMSVGAPNKKTALRWLDQADAYFMYGDDDFYEDSIEKYGWVSKQYELC